jgi:hypothetical protein
MIGIGSVLQKEDNEIAATTLVGYLNRRLNVGFQWPGRVDSLLQQPFGAFKILAVAACLQEMHAAIQQVAKGAVFRHPSLQAVQVVQLNRNVWFFVSEDMVQPFLARRSLNFPSELQKRIGQRNLILLGVLKFAIARPEKNVPTSTIQ